MATSENGDGGQLNAADQAKRDYDTAIVITRDVAKLLTEMADDDSSDDDIRTTATVGQFVATLALAAATRLQAEANWAALQRAEELTAALTPAAAVPPAPDRCPQRSTSGWRCPQPAGHDGMHTIDYAEAPDADMYRATTGEEYVPGSPVGYAARIRRANRDEARYRHLDAGEEVGGPWSYDDIPDVSALPEAGG